MGGAPPSLILVITVIFRVLALLRKLHNRKLSRDRVPESEAVPFNRVDGKPQRFDRVRELHIVQEIHLLPTQHVLRNEQALSQILSP